MAGHGSGAMATYTEHGALYATNGSFVAYLADDTWEDEHDAYDIDAGDEQAHTALASGLGAYTDSGSESDDWMDALPCLKSDSDSEASASANVMLDYSSSCSDKPPPLVHVDSSEDAYSSSDDELPPLQTSTKLGSTGSRGLPRARARVVQRRRLQRGAAHCRHGRRGAVRAAARARD